MICLISIVLSKAVYDHSFLRAKWGENTPYGKIGLRDGYLYNWKN